MLCTMYPCTKYACLDRFEIYGEQYILDETNILALIEGKCNELTCFTVPCFKYIKGKKMLSWNAGGGYELYVNYKDSLYFYKLWDVLPEYDPFYTIKKIKIIEENGVLKICWLVKKDQEGEYYCYELKPMSELLKKYSPGRSQIIKEGFQNLENK